MLVQLSKMGYYYLHDVFTRQFSGEFWAIEFYNKHMNGKKFYLSPSYIITNTYLNNIRNGSSVTHNKKNGAYTEVNYVNGKKHGISKTTYKNSTKCKTGTYVNGVCCGEFIECENGRKTVTDMFHGYRYGTEKVYVNGILEESTEYCKDIIHGMQFTYTNGKLIRVAKYMMGNLCGSISYHPNGQKAQEITTTNFVEYEYTTWDSNGKLHSTYTETDSNYEYPL